MAKEEAKEEEEEKEKPKVKIVKEAETATSRKEGLRATLLRLVILSAVIISVISFVIKRKEAIGPVLVILGFLPWLVLYLAHREIKSAIADIVFGIVNAGILGVMALTGASLADILGIADILGAVIGVAIGNTIINGLAGTFEGRVAEYLRDHGIEDERTALSASMGKMAGCLIGIGIILTIAWTVFGL